MAEGLLRKAIAGVVNARVSSAGIAAMPGLDASSDTRSILNEHQASLDSFKSRQVDEELLCQADLIIPMTSSHGEMIKQFFPECAERVRLLCDYIDVAEGLSGADVPDPIGMGRPAYEEVAKVITLALPGIIGKLEG